MLMGCVWKCYLLVTLLVVADSVLGAYQSAGCSDEGCGIPCYLRPAEDDCHYTDHGDSPCDSGGGDELLDRLWLLNNTLVRLKEKLIQKGVIPAGGNCRPLSNIDNGGVIYSDLLISPGVSGTYVCEEGFSIHGHSKYECAVDGVWLGNTTMENPTCEKSLVICQPLVAIPNGHIGYQVHDTTLITPGNIVTYSCDDPYHLQGADYRVCLKNGTWTGEEPKCKAPVTPPSPQSVVSDNRVAEGVVPVVVFLILLITGVSVSVAVYKLWRRKHPATRDDYDPLLNNRCNEPDGDNLRENYSDMEEVEVKKKPSHASSKDPPVGSVDTITSFPQI